MAKTKSCKQCQSQFVIDDADLEFYKKMSPTFDGKKFEIPAPTLCLDCRRQRRTAWRNMKILYSRKCDYTGENLISPFPPNSRFKVFKNEIWWSDKWSGLEFGQDFDPSKSFFEQLYEVQLKVPNMHAYVNRNENSDFCNCTTNAKDSYLVQSGGDVENCYYSQRLTKTKDCIDCLSLYTSEKCYECVLADDCFDCQYSTDINNCSESLFLDNCIGCKNCFACASLNQKQYWVYNKQATKEEFQKAQDEFTKLRGHEKYDKIDEIRSFLRSFPKKYMHAIANENCTGDYLYHCKNNHNSFMIGYSEEIRNSFNLENAKDSVDHDFWGEGTQMILESEEVGDNAYNIAFSQHCWESSNLLYCIGMVNNSKDCFGCVGLKGAQYCILNKQYSKEEYESLVSEIIDHMQKTNEWGEFFPLKMSYFAYNETAADDYFPIRREEAIDLGANWQDEDFGIKYDGPTYEPEDVGMYANNQEKINEALKGILKCQASGKPYKLQAGEVAFYIKNNIQLPLYHPDHRHKVRFKLLNPLRLWKRECMCEETDHGHDGKCQLKFETTFSPDRSEKIYCEECYNKAVR